MKKSKSTRPGRAECLADCAVYVSAACGWACARREIQAVQCELGHLPAGGPDALFVTVRVLTGGRAVAFQERFAIEPRRDGWTPAALVCDVLSRRLREARAAARERGLT